MFKKNLRETQDFLLSNYFAEGLRITLGVLLPSLVMAHFGQLQTGMTLSLGALCVSIVDSPGPIHHRKNAMLITLGLLVIVSILTGLTNRSDWFIGTLLFVLSFIFSMIAVYGNRAASIGTSILLITVLSIDDVRAWKEVILYGTYIGIGGLWYTLLSYFSYRLRPYRLATQTLSESIYEVAKFLRIKARFYDKKIDFDEIYAELLKLQVEVNHRQEEVREVLFKTRTFLRDSSPYSRFLLVVFTDMVDLFEQIMSTYYNYKHLHKQFDSTGILKRYHHLIVHIAEHLEDIAFVLKSGGKPMDTKMLKHEVRALRMEIELLEADFDNNISNEQQRGFVALLNIYDNIKNIVKRIDTINAYFDKKLQSSIKPEKIDTSKFIHSQEVNARIFIDNLSFDSSTFRHALRVAIVMLVGFIVSRHLQFSHSYWTLLTILVISKPGFSLTKERNYHRIIGTVVGALIGVAILHFVKDKNALFVILMLFMIASYSFQRKNYVISVLFMTPFILIVFDFLGLGIETLAKERVINTLIGSGIALAASYSLFPNWEYKNLEQAMADTLKANRNYLKELYKLCFDNQYDNFYYKLSRKEVFVKSSNLASIFQRMLTEPKNKQINIKELHQFTVLNHLLSSYVASLSNTLQNGHQIEQKTSFQLKAVADNSLLLLEIAVNSISTKQAPKSILVLMDVPESENDTELENNIEAQLLLIQKVSFDIAKISQKFTQTV